MAGKGRGGDGVKYLGLRHGEKWWEARFTWVDPRTGEKHDKQATYAANSKLLAQQERAKRLKRAQEEAAGRLKKRFGEVLDEWLATLDTFGTAKSWGSHARRIRKHFGTWWIEEMGTRDMQAWLGAQKRLDGKPLEKGTFNSMRDVLVKAFDHAVEKGYVDANLARLTLRKKSARTREDALAELADDDKRALTSEEAVKVLRDLLEHEPDMYPLLAVMFILGCRFAEASALRRDGLDVRTGVVFIAWSQTLGRVGPTKGKRRRKAALGGVGLELVRAHLARMDELKWPGHEELLFPRKPEQQGWKSISHHWSYTTVRQALLDCFERQGLDMANATHAARHTMNNLASQELARAELSEGLLRKVVGHSTAQIAQTYRHPEDAEVISLAKVVESRLFSVAGKSGTKSGTKGVKRGR